MVDFVNRWSSKTGIGVLCMLLWLGLARSKWYNWKSRYGKANEHNAWIPRDHWLQEWEKQAIVSYHEQYPLEGYRRLTFMMLDAGVVAASPSSVYRVLKAAGVLERHNAKPSKKGTGFVQPLRPHEHWHVDIAYLNLSGTFYYLCSILDGCSRYIVHWEIRETMTEAEVETIVQRARERFAGERPRIITDNGPQFVAKDFKEFIREDAQRVVSGYVAHYNEVRLHSAIGYISPKDKLEGREQEIFAERDRKLEEAREQRKTRRAEARGGSSESERQ